MQTQPLLYPPPANRAPAPSSLHPWPGPAVHLHESPGFAATRSQASFWKSGLRGRDRAEDLGAVELAFLILGRLVEASGQRPTATERFWQFVLAIPVAAGAKAFRRTSANGRARRRGPRRWAARRPLLPEAVARYGRSYTCCSSSAILASLRRINRAPRTGPDLGCGDGA